MEWVKLSHTQLQHLCDCLKTNTSLQTLTLVGLSCSDCGDQCRNCLDLSALTQLQTLDLASLPVTRLSLGSSKLESVELVSLSKLETAGSVLTSLIQSPGLRKLEVTHCSLSPGDVSTLVNILPKLPQLEGLWLWGIDLGDQEVITTSNMSQLRCIVLASVTMSASSWRQFIQTLPRPSHQLLVTLYDCNVDKETKTEVCSSPGYKVTHSDDTDLDFLTVPQTISD